MSVHRGELGSHFSVPYRHASAGLPLAATTRHSADLLLLPFGEHLLGTKSQSMLTPLLWGTNFKKFHDVTEKLLLR